MPVEDIQTLTCGWSRLTRVFSRRVTWSYFIWGQVGKRVCGVDYQGG